MSIRSILGIFLTVTACAFLSGCGGGDELTVVQPDEAHMQQLQADEDLEESGATTANE